MLALEIGLARGFMYKERKIGSLNLAAITVIFMVIIGSVYFYLLEKSTLYLIAGIVIPTALTYLIIVSAFKSKSYDDKFKDRHGFDPAYFTASYTDLIIISITEIFYHLFISPIYSLFAKVSNKMIKASDEIKEIEND